MVAWKCPNMVGDVDVRAGCWIIIIIIFGLVYFKRNYKHIIRPSLGVATLLCCLRRYLCWLGWGLGLSIRLGVISKEKENSM